MTRWVLATSDIVRDDWWAVLAVALAVVFAARYAFERRRGVGAGIARCCACRASAIL